MKHERIKAYKRLHNCEHSYEKFEGLNQLLDLKKDFSYQISHWPIEN